MSPVFLLGNFQLAYAFPFSTYGQVADRQTTAIDAVCDQPMAAWAGIKLSTGKCF